MCPAPQSLDSEAEPQQQWGTVALAVERETWDPSAQPRDGPALRGTEAPPLQDVGTLGRRFARPPQVPLPLPATYRRAHSRASQLLALSSLSCELDLGLDLQLQQDRLSEKPLAWDPPPHDLGQSRVRTWWERLPRGRSCRDTGAQASVPNPDLPAAAEAAPGAALQPQGLLPCHHPSLQVLAVAYSLPGLCAQFGGAAADVVARGGQRPRSP